MDSPRPPLDLQWVFGLSSDVRGGVVDLRTGTRNTIAYAAGHILVIYDCSQHQQMFLQGHVHQIQCLSACPKKRFIASADCGPDAILIVWNSSSGKNRTQTLSIWNLESKSCKMVTSLSVFVTDPQHCLQINKDDQDEVVTNGKESVLFWKCFKDVEGPNKSVGAVLKHEQAMANTVEVQKNICEFTLSSFVPSSNSAITGMISGEVIFWQEPRSPFFKEPSKPFFSVTTKENKKDESSARRMYAVKIVRLHHSPITHVSVWGSHVVTGGSDGYIRFYDPHLGLVGWFEELQAGEITSISFSAMDKYKQENRGLTLEVPPFVLGTKKGHVLFLHAAIFEEQPGSLQHKGEEMMDFVPKLVKSVSAHPRLPHFAIVNAEGSFQVHDYNTRRLCSQREFSKLRAETIAYSPSGSVIACGFFNGYLKIVDSGTLQDMENIAISRSGITKLEFASNETLLAVGDASFAVSLVSCSISEDHLEDKWEYIGKFRSHARTIAGLHFTRDVDGNNRLFSVGHDCMIVEYDLLESVKEKRLKLRGTWPLNAVGIPMALFSTTSFREGELHLLISDSSFKIRVYDTQNFACHKTFLGPTFGTPVKHMFPISREQSLQDTLAFGTEDQIVGVMVFPLEKNKNLQYVGVVGHAGCIQHMTPSYDRKFLITIAVHDGIINLWRVSLPLVENYFEKESEPILGHFKGTSGNRSLQLIKEYFFTCQIFSQGESFPNERVLDATLDIEQLHNLLSAVGVFPSFHEIQEIVTEINETFPSKRSISFTDFLPIFLNHRPVMELDASVIQQAFTALGSDIGSGRLNLEHLLTMLQNEGERMTREEIQQCLESILNKHVDLDTLPRDINATWFCNKVLML